MEGSPLDWKLLTGTFVAIFLAELGDKTQLATLSAVAAGGSRKLVFAGAAFALLASTLLTVLVGDALTRVVPRLVLERIAAGAFLAVGGYLLWQSFR